MEKETTVHGKLTAIQYLIDHSVYQDEWSGAGMYEAIMKIMKASGTVFTKKLLDSMLKGAEAF